MSGFFEIGIYRPKTAENVGTLWRSAYQLGAAGIFTVGHRYTKQASDTVSAWRHIPLRNYTDLLAFQEMKPYAAVLVGVEIGGEPLNSFTHPREAIYLLGAEDNGLPPEVLAKCQKMVSIEATRTQSFNVAVAGSIVMWDRLRKHLRADRVLPEE